MFLWDKIVFGPIKSRRLGNSLGINISPIDIKVCSFDCIYCECGWTLEKKIDSALFKPFLEIIEALDDAIMYCWKRNIKIDSITFSGNGEPTLHPQFDDIINHLIHLRNEYYPNTVISCLSNSSMLIIDSVLTALQKIENPILKLDAVSEELFQLINKPTIPISVDEIIQQLMKMNGNFIMQTLFFKGKIDGVYFDNSNEKHLSLWLEVVQELHPKQVMLYSLDRSTPAQNLEKIPIEKLTEIAGRLRSLGIDASAY